MAKIDINGVVRDMTPEEIVAHEAAVKAHFVSMSYEEAVNAEIRKRYSVSQEFAILRQRDEKPAEYSAYFAYCEECKAFVKSQRASFGG